jgi:hypothetical protein
VIPEGNMEILEKIENKIMEKYMEIQINADYMEQ